MRKVAVIAVLEENQMLRILNRGGPLSGAGGIF